MRRSHRIADWDPEELPAWEAGNRAIARRNLIWSVATVHLGHSVWSLWSVMVLFMPDQVYGFSTSDKFLLAATATLVGACLRLPYSMAAMTFGGRNWTIFSAFVLLIPTGTTLVLLARPGLPLWPYLVCAALTGLGGGNFAASTPNASAFYPHRLKGSALGLIGGAANLGVPMVQLAGLLVISATGNQQPYWVCAVYLLVITIVGILATLFLDDLTQHRIAATHLPSILSSILRHRHTWLIALLYLGTFGSFIGYAFAFGHLLQLNFMTDGQDAAQASLHAAQIAFIGPMLASVARIYGGRLADRFGGGRVTVTVFAAMFVAAALTGIGVHDKHSPVAGSAVTGYITGFIVLFILAGVGNASVYKMIPTVFEARSHGVEHAGTRDPRWSHGRAGLVGGFVATFGALGGFAISLAMRQSYLSTGSVTPAFGFFTVCYAAAAVLTWVVYARRPARSEDSGARPRIARRTHPRRTPPPENESPHRRTPG